MTLGLSQEHLDLAAAVRGWAGRHCPAEVVRASADGPGNGCAGYRETLAPGLAAQGILGLHLPSSSGGQGYGLPELAVALAELGRALVPGGFLPTVLAGAVLAEAASGAGPAWVGAMLTALAEGSAAGAVALGPGLAGRPAGDGGLIVDGTTGPVLGAPLADLVIAPVRVAGEERWVAADAASLAVTVLDGLDRTRPIGQVGADGAVIPAGRILAGVSRGRITSLAAVLFGAEACGIAGWAVEAAADYARTRHQFGRPIGQFQAVKHRCARMLTAAEQAEAAVWDAARAACPAPAAADRAGGEATGAGAEVTATRGEFAACAAAVVALDAAVSNADEYIQTLGGIGYTWEHDAHLYYRRALSLRALLGSSAAWRERIAGLALAGASRHVEVELPGGDAAQRAQIRAELAGLSRLAGPDRAAGLAAGGWVMPHLPPPWGRGAGALEQLVIEQELRAAGLRPPMLAIGAWVVPALIAHGSPAQQERFLPPTLRGDFLWCQLFSEPGAGSDLAGIASRAERAEGGWKITGQKIWTSLAREAAWAICIARTDPAAPRHGGITYFLVDMSAPGVQVLPLREITGHSMFNQVFLDEVFVPGDCVVGEVNGGWRVARTTLANERVSLSRSWSFGCGVPELLDAARAAPCPPLAELGQLIAQGHALDLLGLRVTLKQLSGTDPGATGSVRKLLGMRHAQQVAELCWAMSGSAGALGAAASPPGLAAPPAGADGRLASGHWARQVLATRALTIGGGTTDIQLNIIAERLLGLPRDPDPPA